MEHLTLETLARLVSEAPDPGERRHLSECPACRAELEELEAQTRALRELPDLRPPLGDWAVLEARLTSEGLVRGDRSFMSMAATPAWMKVAAVLLVFLGGTGLGMGLVSRGAVPGIAGGPSDAGAPYTLTASQAETLPQAEAAVRLAERRYMDALVQYRQLLDAEGGSSRGASPESRLAALEYLVAAGQAALEQAPADPVINGFLASALAERQATRQATLRQFGSADDWY
ncbi:MAG: hypothetical protein P8188_05600 [Gemmatimonadota bacterium]|jgi:hypothetical protein